MTEILEKAGKSHQLFDDGRERPDPKQMFIIAQY